MTKQLLLSLLCASLVSCTYKSNLQLASMISDGMVLQQKKQVTLWGYARPGTHVEIDTDWGFSTSSTANPQNEWMATITTLSSDFEKHQITISAPDTVIVLNDILIGEVWLASGQSNMEMPLAGWGNDSVFGGQQTISEANDDFMRFFTVERNASLNSHIDIRGKWLTAKPENVESLSSTAYYFAQNLRDSLQIPIGVVVSCWGGSPIDAWIGEEWLRKDSTMLDCLNSLPQIAAETNTHEQWLLTHPARNLLSINPEDPYANIEVDHSFATNPASNISEWPTMTLPGYWEEKTDLVGFDGVVWFVKDVVIPPTWVGKSLRLHLGPIDDRDVTFVNGTIVGQMQANNVYNVEREYDIPRTLVTSNTLRIAIKVTDHAGNGGFAGCDKGMLIVNKHTGKGFSIEGEWKYAVAAEFAGNTMYEFNMATNEYARHNKPSKRIDLNTPTALFTGMIKTIANYGYTGAIWYQGEANVDDPATYYKRQKTLVDCWRSTLGNGLSFCLAQIAPYSYSDCNNHEAAHLREAQRRAASETDQCEMISTLDIGSDLTIHPGNKQEVGRRLALRALKLEYGRNDIVDAGPEFADVFFNKHLAIVSFRNDNGLYIDPDLPNEFELIDENGDAFAATAIVNAGKLMLFSHSVPHPTAVRYAGRNCSRATLFNAEGLPAPSFDTSSFD